MDVRSDKDEPLLSPSNTVEFQQCPPVTFESVRSSKMDPLHTDGYDLQMEIQL
jgi:hypothetical protein